jgi:hypothetical protein
MSVAGELDETVNQGKVLLINTTDSEDYKQLHRMRVSITQQVIRNYTMSNTVDKHFQPRDFVVEGDIWVTEPEVATWIARTVHTNNLPDFKGFQIQMTADNGDVTNITGTFRIRDIIYDVPEEGDTNYHVVLESINGVPTAS